MYIYNCNFTYIYRFINSYQYFLYIQIVHLTQSYMLLLSMHMYGCQISIKNMWDNIRCKQIYIYIHMFICISMYICIYHQLYICIHIHMLIYIYIYIYVYENGQINTYMYTCTCTYICIYTYSYLSIYIYLHIYIQREVCLDMALSEANGLLARQF